MKTQTLRARILVWLLCSTLLASLTGCGGGSGGGSALTQPSTAFVQVRVAVPQVSSRAHDSLVGVTELVFHVVDPVHGADLVPASAPVPVNGQASVSTTLTVPSNAPFKIVVDAFTNGSPAGSATSASISLAGGATQSVTLTITPGGGVPAKLHFVNAIGTSEALSAIAGLAVQVEDANGAVVTGATNPVTLSIGINPPGNAVLGGTNPVNAVNGTATFTDVTLSAAGNGFTLVASSPGLTSDTTNPFQVTGFTALTNVVFVANPAARTVSAFNVVGLTPVAGFTSPVFPATPTALMAANSVVFVGLSNGQVEQFRVDSAGTVTPLPVVIVPGGAPITSLGFAIGSVMWVTTNATTNNVFTFPTNATADFRMAPTPSSTTTVGGAGNTPVLFGGFNLNNGAQFVVDVLSNGAANNVTRLVVVVDGQGNILTVTPQTPITIGGAGNTPIAVGLGTFTEFFVSNGTANNMTGVNIFNQTGAVISTVSAVAPVAAKQVNGFFQVLTGAAAFNLIPVDISNGTASAGTPSTVGGVGNTPVSAGPQPGQLPSQFLLVTTSGAANNVDELDVSGGTLTSTLTATAGSAAPVSPSNM